MLNRLVGWTMIVAILACGCSVPDPNDENWRQLVAVVGHLPANIKVAAKLEEANGAASRWWRMEAHRRHRGVESRALMLNCAPMSELGDDDITATFQRFEISIGQILQCLADVPKTTFTGCAQRLADKAAQELGLLNSEEYGCSWFTVDEAGHRSNEEDKHPDWNEHRILDADIARSLFIATAPPKWFLAALAGAGGASGLSAIEVLEPMLCPEGVHWSCPSSPLYPGGSMPQRKEGSDQ